MGDSDVPITPEDEAPSCSGACFVRSRRRVAASGTDASLCLPVPNGAEGTDVPPNLSTAAVGGAGGGKLLVRLAFMRKHLAY